MTADSVTLLRLIEATKGGLRSLESYRQLAERDVLKAQARLAKLDSEVAAQTEMLAAMEKLQKVVGDGETITFKY